METPKERMDRIEKDVAEYREVLENDYSDYTTEQEFTPEEEDEIGRSMREGHMVMVVNNIFQGIKPGMFPYQIDEVILKNLEVMFKDLRKWSKKRRIKEYQQSSAGMEVKTC